MKNVGDLSSIAFAKVLQQRNLLLQINQKALSTLGNFTVAFLSQNRPELGKIAVNSRSKKNMRESSAKMRAKCVKNAEKCGKMRP